MQRDTARRMPRKKNPHPKIRVTANLPPDVFENLKAEADARQVDPGTIAGERIAKRPWKKPKETP